MKSIPTLAALVTCALVLCVSCDEQSYIPSPGDNTFNQDSLVFTIVDTSGISISIDSALAICNSLQPGAITAERYKLIGEITQTKTNPNDVPGLYTNINFIIKDATGTITCQYTNDINNRPFMRSDRIPRAGTKLTVVGPLSLYQSSNGNTTQQMLNGFVACYDSLVVPPPFPGCPEPAEGQISVSKAIQLAGLLEQGETSSETYDIVGIVTDITELDTGKYGNATFNISENGKNAFLCYRAKGLNGAKFTAENQLLYGDTIVIQGKLKNHYGTLELDMGGKILSSSNPNLR